MSEPTETRIRRDGPFSPWLDRLLAIPLSIPAAIVSVAFVSGVVGLVGLEYPAVADTTGIDGQAVWLGNWLLFRDPADGYTAAAYTPLLSYLAGLLDQITVWRGWGSLLNLLASAGLAGVAAALAWRPRSDARIDRLVALVEAVGLGALAWWAVSAGFLESFQSDRPDQIAWTVALTGLILVPSAASGSRTASWLAIGLLSAGFWAKQPALAAAGAAVVFLVIGVFAGWLAPRRAMLGLGVFALLNTAIMAALTALTDGWQAYFNLYLLAARTACCELSADPGEYVRLFTAELLAAAFPVVAFAGGLGLVAVAGWFRSPRTEHRGPRGLRDRVAAISPEARVALILVVFCLIGLVGAAWARKGIGSAPNQSLGVVWALALLGAVSYRFARARRASALAATAVVLALLAASAWQGTVSLNRYAGRFSPLDVSMSWSEIPDSIVAYSRGRSVYHPVFSDLSATRSKQIYPNWISLTPVLLSDHTAGALEQAILERRFDTVWPFTPHQVTHPLSNLVEENYLWKLNQLIKLKYPLTRSAPAGGRDRGPAADPAPWVDACLGPFDLAGVEFRQHRGGGFWCRRGDRLTIDRLPPGVSVSEVRTIDPIEAMDGTLGVLAPERPGGFDLFADLDGEVLWRVRGVADSDKTLIDGQTDDRETAPIAVRGEDGPADRVGLRLRESEDGEMDLRATRDGAAVTVPALPEGARLNLAATQDSSTSFDLSDLVLEQ